MKSYADTSFVISLYRKETTTELASQTVRGSVGPILLSPLSLVEIRNGLQLAVFRQELRAADALRKWQLFNEDMGNGVFVVVEMPEGALFSQALDLVGLHTGSLGTRSLDILHIAAARLAGARRFLSFDPRQRRLAEVVGMQVLPGL